MNPQILYKRVAHCFLLLLILAGCQRVESLHAPVQTTITALIWAPDWPEEMLKIAADFSKANPDVRVNIQFMIGNSVEQNIKPRIASGNFPDIMSVNPNAYAAGLADQGVLAEVGRTRAWNNMLDNLKDDWSTTKHRHFGISGGVATTLIYYNKAMFAKAGIVELPDNFAEFLIACEKLKRAGYIPIVWNGGFPNMLGNGPFSSGFANNVVANEPDWKAKILGGTLNLNTPQTADIFAKMLLVASRGYAQPGFMSTSYDDGIRLFTEGRAAMAFQGSWSAGLLMHGRGLQSGVFLPPWNAPGNTAVPVIGSETGFAVCETANKQASMRFLEYIAGSEFALVQNKRLNVSPFKHDAGKVLSDPQILAYTRMVEASPVKGSIYYSFLPANTITLLHRLMQNVLLGEVSPAQAAKILDKSIKVEAKLQYK